jgi:murein L,D-transpeptidase YafK
MKLLVVTIVVLAIAFVTFYYFVPEPRMPNGTKIDRLVVTKSKRILEAYSDGKVIKRYEISLGGNPVGDKQFEGDKRTPEGNYIINDKNANSGYHKNLGISYPDANDVREAKKRNVSPGGQIKIHGLPNGYGFIGKFQRLTDWTAGCIALTDEEVDELYSNVKIGTPITILP